MNDNKLSCTEKWFCKLCIIVSTCILSVCLYSSSQSPQALDQSKDSAQSPLYAKYYDQVLALEKAGKPAAALAAILKRAFGDGAPFWDRQIRSAKVGG